MVRERSKIFYATKKITVFSFSLNSKHASHYVTFSITIALLISLIDFGPYIGHYLLNCIKPLSDGMQYIEIPNFRNRFKYRIVLVRPRIDFIHSQNDFFFFFSYFLYFDILFKPHPQLEHFLVSGRTKRRNNWFVLYG